MMLLFLDFEQIIIDDHPFFDGNNFIIREGESANITYTIDTHPFPTITLRRLDDRPVNDMRFQITNQALVLVNVLREDAGRYTLAFVNVINRIQYTRDFIVNCK